MNAPVHLAYITSFQPLAPFGNLDRVRLTAAVEDDQGRLVEAGTCGTVVAIYADGAAYEVDFFAPTETNATVEAEKLERIEPE